MKKNSLAFVWGLLFGIGLIIAQMTNPANVLAFLDVAGSWNPRLALVMIGALATLGSAHYILHRNQTHPALQPIIQSIGNIKRDIDWRLIAGASLFGIGWGLSGFCPGPALIALTSGRAEVLIFGGGMFAGFFLFHLLFHKHKR